MKKYLLKTCSRTMAVCLLLSALAACNPEVPPADGTETSDGVSSGIVSDTVSETETVEDLSVHYKTPIICKSGDTPFYEGKTAEELYAIYEQCDAGERSALVTGTGRFYCAYEGEANPFVSFYDKKNSFVSFYDKRKGEFFPLCEDPQCGGGEDCVWNGMCGLSYVSADHIYFQARNSEGDLALYRSDLARQNVDRLMSFTREEYIQVYNPDGTPLGDATWLSSMKILYEQGDCAYFASLFFADGGYKRRLCVMDMSTRKITAISGDKDIGVIEILGGRVIYSLAEDPYNLYETDLTFENSEMILENVEIALCSGQYLILYKKDENSMTNAYQSYCLNTGETVELGEFEAILSRTFCLSGDYLYYTRALSDDEIANDPIRNYYTYQWKDLTDDGYPFVNNGQTRGGGRVYRIKVSEANPREECVLQLTYKDVPVRIQNIELDGDVIYVAFHNYEGFKNYYNKKFEGNVKETLCYGIVDLQHGSFTLLNMTEKE